MPTLRLPPVLRAHAAGARTVDVDGATLREALDDLFARHPDIRGQLVDEHGQLNAFVNVYVDNDDVRLRDGLDTALGAASSVIVLPAMAGG